MYQRFFCIAIFSFLVGHAAEPVSESCVSDVRSMRAGLRHIEAGGIGYNNGYTTFEAFLASPPELWPVMPFLDVRGHAFDDGKWAANAGLGLRGLAWNRVFGASVYYDYRNTTRQSYNQVSFGLETLGKWVDARVNGYFPVGPHISSPYNIQFGSFAGNNIFLNETFQYALTGANGELGIHLPSYKDFNFYTAAGPYYLVGKIGSNIWGGEIRFNGNYKNYITVEISYSYDNVFKNIVQGQLGINIPFGPKLGGKKDDTRSCSQRNMMNSRMLQPVTKNEIIPITSSTKEEIGINPLTGNPYYFAFVDNTSHSSGTYESPYSTLISAQNNTNPGDIIYVFPGDGTTNGMQEGIALQPNQKFWGAGTAHLLETAQGRINIPQQNFSMPSITNSSGNGVTLSTDNEISGFNILYAAYNGIAGTDPANVSISSCIMVGSGVGDFGDNHINLSYANTTGTVSMDNLTLMESWGDGIFISTTNAVNPTISLSNSSILNSGYVNESRFYNGITIQSNSTAPIKCTFVNNVIQTNSANSINASFTGPSNLKMIDNAILSNFDSCFLNFASDATLLISGNEFNWQIVNQGDPGLLIMASGNSMIATLENNTLNGNYGGGVEFALDGNNLAELTLINNTITGSGPANGEDNPAVWISTTGSVTDCNVVLTNNTINGNALYAVGVGSPLTTAEFTNCNLILTDNFMNSIGGLIINSVCENLVLNATKNVCSSSLNDGILISGIIANADLTFSRNQINYNTTVGLQISHTGDNLTFVAKNNLIQGNQQGGLNFGCQITEGNITISENNISYNNSGLNSGGGLAFGYQGNPAPFANLTAIITNNTLLGNAVSYYGLNYSFTNSDISVVAGTGNSCVYMSDNTADVGYVFNQVFGPLYITPCNVESINRGEFLFTGTAAIKNSCSGTSCP